jgi:hypothetical protein
MVNRRSVVAVSILLIITLIFSMACHHTPVNVNTQPAVCFATQVLPIFQSNCAKSGCHNGQREGRTNLSTDAGIRGDVTPYKPLDSQIYQAITDTWGNIMPPSPNSPLPKESRTVIYLWILQGADTTCTGVE